MLKDESLNEEKTRLVTVRMSEQTMKKLQSKAVLKNKDAAEFADELIVKGLKSRSQRNSGKLCTLVEIQQGMNELVRKLGSDQNELKEELIRIEKEVIRLWE